MNRNILVFLFFFIFCRLSASGFFLAGGAEGLFKISGFKTENLWSGAKVHKIIKSGIRWLFLTDNGIAASYDLHDFFYLNETFPKKIIKHIDAEGGKVFIEKMPQLKDLEVHPFASDVFVTASSSKVFLTADAGKTWQDLGAQGFINGIKAVSVLDLPGKNGKNELTVFVSHALYGVAWQQPEVETGIWYGLSDGLEHGPEGIDEVSDIVFNGEEQTMYCTQGFSGGIYRLNWNKKCFEKVYTIGKEPLIYADSLFSSGGTIAGVKKGGIFDINVLMPNFKTYTAGPLFKGFETIKMCLQKAPYLCAYIPEDRTPFKKGISLSELWLLGNGEKSELLEKASGKKGIYIPVHQVRDEKKFEEHIAMLKSYNLNAVVIDMKDDAGFVRYDSKEPDIQKYGGVKKTVNLDALVQKARTEGIYLIARIVVFKDRNLYSYSKGRFAVKDKKTGLPWQGYRTYGKEKKLIEEHWVDPYNETVWKYNADIAAELSLRGIDEIQFDYIRFPTDGDNMAELYYPASGNGMDKESAIMSFLAYTRTRINAPISIDIYGSNGWYRTGARTGQEVELLAEYVDVLCPMLYPSHFSQNFLAHKSAEDRPFRIYHQGAWRNKMIARSKVIVRPWAQAFYLPVSYDKKYYGKNYVKRQILGIKDSIDEGYIYWNNSGKYKDIRPDGEGLNLTNHF